MSSGRDEERRRGQKEERVLLLEEKLGPRNARSSHEKAIQEEDQEREEGRNGSCRKRSEDGLKARKRWKDRSARKERVVARRG